MNKLLINHLGYDLDQPKTAVLQTLTGTSAKTFRVLKLENGQHIEIHNGLVETSDSIDNWQLGQFAHIDFSTVNQEGQYVIEAETENDTVCSEPFNIGVNLIQSQTVSELLSYFQNQRCTGIYQETDEAIPFFGDTRNERVDVRGGWYDASGDVSKYLSHLSYANFMNPQQTPMVVWNLLHALDSQATFGDELSNQIQQEALYGADFLIRMQDEAGYFYTTVFDNWSHDPSMRYICSYQTQQGHKNQRWQAGYRQGGGIAIAALARASTHKQGGEFSSEQYLAAAMKGFQHLEEHNLHYLDDGKENIIDDYCALLAATELYAITHDNLYLVAAKTRLESLIARVSDDSTLSGWLRADDKSRPYFHAAEEGLPIVALLRAIEIGVTNLEQQQKTELALLKQAEFYLEIGQQVHNPFLYARQYHQNVNGERKPAFFYPHHNESGYWWQGENARLASLSCAFTMLNQHFKSKGRALPEIESYACAQINWVLGLNPMDMCMMDGQGRNNPAAYDPDHKSIRGGVCNGITSGFKDESGIDFAATDDPMHSWRWSEQWIPHVAWLLLAIAVK